MNTIMVTKRQLAVRTGCEGPQYDPYHYEERIVRINDVTVKLHTGLGVWCKAFTKADSPLETRDEKLAVGLFEAITGMTVDTFDRAYARLHWNDEPDPMGSPSMYI
jgi:hypothetical protein